MTKRLRQFLPKAGFDPTDLLQMGNAAKQSTATTLLGARIKKRFDGTWYGGEIVAYLGEESGRQGGWKIKYDDGDEEGMNRAALEKLVTSPTLLGRKVSKQFDDGVFYDGEIIEFAPYGETKGSPWRVLYQDGDVEDMSRSELENKGWLVEVGHGDHNRMTEGDAYSTLWYVLFFKPGSYMYMPMAGMQPKKQQMPQQT